MDIDFLSNNQDKNKKRQKKRSKENIEWSKPSREQSQTVDSISTKNKKIGTSKMPNIFKHGEKKAVMADFIDKKQLSASRKQVLQDIKAHNKTQKIKNTNDIKKINNKQDSKSKRSFWKEIFKLFKPKKKDRDINHKKSLRDETLKSAKRRQETLRDAKKEIEREKEVKDVIIEEPKAITRKEEEKEKQEEVKVDFSKKIEKEDKSKEVNKKSFVDKFNKWFKNFISKFKKPRSDLESKSKMKNIDEDLNNPEVLETNLIKGEVFAFYDWTQRFIVLAVFVLLSLALVVGAYWGVSLWGEKKLATQQDFLEHYTSLEDDIKNVKEKAKEALAFRNELTVVNNVLDQHIYWSSFFDFLEKYTLENVIYKGGFHGDNQGEYTFNAETTDYDLIEAQVREFLKSPYILEAKVREGAISDIESLEGVGISFSLDIVLDPKIFNESTQ